MELFPHQRKAVNELHSGAVLWGDVGTGKTLTALTYYVEREAPRDIIVITTAKKRDSLDWQRDAARLAIGGDRGSTFYGVLTVDSWNNIGEYADRRDAFFIFDEQRVVGSGAWTKSFISIAKNNHWILCSATPGDTWLDYVPVFVANGYFKNRTEFLQNHVVFNRFSKFPKVDRYTGVGKLVRLKNQTLVHMPFERETTRKTEIVHVDHDVKKMERVLNERWHVFENRPLRQVAELFLVMRKVVNYDASRIEAVRRLAQNHPKLIVFYNFDFELEALRSLGQSSKSSSEKNSPTGSGSGCADEIGERRLSSDKLARDRFGMPNEPTQTPAGIESSTGLTEPWDSAQAAALPSVLNGSPRTTGSTTALMTAGSGSAFVLAEWNGHKHEPIPTSDRWIYLVQYVAGSEGWNCIETDAMVFYSLTYSYKNWHQAHGRIDRLNTPFKTLYYYVLMSNSVIDKAIWRSLMGKKNFNESQFVKRFIDTDPQKEVIAA